MDGRLAMPDRSVRWRTGTIANYGQTNGTTEDTGMDKITGLFVKVREYQKGQTMAEYALIMAAVAVVVFVGYQTMGSTITTLLTTVDGKL
jgi:Flp pilus assembly pilin Flp